MRNVARKLRRLGSLSGEERLVLIEAWWELARADFLVSALRYQWWRAELEPVPGAGPPPHLERIAFLVAAAAAHHVRPMNCIRRAIALRRMLGRRGVGVKLRFGVRRSADSIDGHVWVEAGGRSFEVGSLPDRYAELFSHQDATR